jgi:hypothetical protein
MKKAKEILSYILLVFSFTIVITDNSIQTFFDSADIETCDACADISNHFEHSHSRGMEDHFVIIEIKSKETRYNLQDNFISENDINIYYSFISEIWQPPKLS